MLVERRKQRKGGGAERTGRAHAKGAAPSPAYVSDFLATSAGLALIKAFTRIKDAKLRRRIVDLVEEVRATNSANSRHPTEIGPIKP